VEHRSPTTSSRAGSATPTGGSPTSTATAGAPRWLGSGASDATARRQVNGTWSLLTVKPGRIPGPGGVLQTPHVDLSIFARGMLNRLVTRLYFADEPEANSQDPVLRSIPETRRATVLAEPVADGYRLDLRLQGPEETVFFAL
jgi:protocatechuate 3,4-dioxygenase beta subunit